METSNIQDIVFRKAVEAIDTGDIHALQQLMSANPRLLHKKLINGEQGYFKDPYLLYFVAGNPIRNERLPDNIVAITKVLIDALKLTNATSLQQQLDYTLGLVATGRIPKECGVQIALMDLLLAEGAAPGNSLGALANNNIDAAKHLVEKGAPLTLAVATGLGWMEHIARLAPTAGPKEKLTALTVAAFYGNANLVALLLGMGAEPNGYPQDEGFHHHATPLHQAVSAGSLPCVKLLVDAGASLQARDTVYNGTPLGWAEYLQRAGEEGEGKREGYKEIEGYLNSLEA